MEPMIVKLGLKVLHMRPCTLGVEERLGALWRKTQEPNGRMWGAACRDGVRIRFVNWRRV